MHTRCIASGEPSTCQLRLGRREAAAEHIPKRSLAHNGQRRVFAADREPRRCSRTWCAARHGQTCDATGCFEGPLRQGPVCVTPVTSHATVQSTGKDPGLCWMRARGCQRLAGLHQDDRARTGLMQAATDIEAKQVCPRCQQHRAAPPRRAPEDGRLEPGVGHARQGGDIDLDRVLPRRPLVAAFRTHEGARAIGADCEDRICKRQ
mmetsp:Transcript_76632/g.194442  ORF Transcript_76632/g.194442 Transcript_76632/m.194442 type:complete len:206 (+) Transcript_76632:1900-2517(+)